MSQEYIIRLDATESEPSRARLETLFQSLPDYAGQVQYPSDLAFEFRTKANRDPQKMPDLTVISNARDVVISSNNRPILNVVVAALVLEFVNGPSEHLEVLRA